MFQSIAAGIARKLLGSLVTPALVRKGIDLAFVEAHKAVDGLPTRGVVLAEFEAKLDKDALAKTIADLFSGNVV